MADPPVDAPVVASQSDQLPDRGAGFQIRLHHLFAVTAVLAAQLAIAGPQGLLDLPNQSAGSLQTIQLVCGLAHVIPTSIALTALGYGIVAYRRGQLFFNQPGHWLLVEISLITLLSIPTTLLMRWIAADGRLAHSDSDFALFLMIGVYSLLVLVVGRMAINIYFGVTKCRQSRWKSVFFAKAAASIVLGLGDLVVIALLLLAMRTDRREQLLRNAGHWCGAYVQLAISLLAFFVMLLGIVGMLWV